MGQNALASEPASSVVTSEPAKKVTNETANEPADEMEVLLVSLRINQQMMQQPVVMLRTSSGEWWLPVPVLTLAKVKIPDAPLRRFNDADYIAAALLPIEVSNFDAATLFMDIQLRLALL